MDEIMNKVRELGDLIATSPQMKRVKEAEAAKEEDENAKTYMLEYNMKRMNLARDMEAGKISQEDAIKANQDAFGSLVERSETIKEYVEAKKELDKIITQVNVTLNYYITGKTSGGCSGDCGSCGGCN